ncbi:MAG TPA: RluA family pseudouridine synthase [Thermotoga sp.]|nr:RluA family pseudouridine synthase [Thermotoga sp.]
MFREKVEKQSYYQRLDRFLRKKLPDVPLSVIYKLLRKGKVYINGKRERDPSFRLEIGDIVEIRYVNIDKFRRAENRSLEPQPMELDIIFENDRYLVLNKPAGIPIHPGKGVHVVTLIEGLMYYGNKKGFTPHLVHRLDKQTSGVLIVAKDVESARMLSRLFKDRKVKKIYICLVKGMMKEKEGIVNEPIENQEALTEYVVLKNYNEVSLLRVIPYTGRKHQIRKHMFFINHPVVGDNLYGDKEFNKQFKRKYGLKRFFLHCEEISFFDPWEMKKVRFKSPLPEDLSKVLSLLEKER